MRLIDILLPSKPLQVIGARLIQSSEMAASCKNGHLFTSENKIWKANGSYQCRTCVYESNKRSRK